MTASGMYLVAAIVVVLIWTVVTVRPERPQSVAVRAVTTIADWSVAWPKQRTLWLSTQVVVANGIHAHLMHAHLSRRTRTAQKQPMPVRRDSAR